MTPETASSTQHALLKETLPDERLRYVVGRLVSCFFSTFPTIDPKTRNRVFIDKMSVYQSSDNHHSEEPELWCLLNPPLAT
jgi:hypothetical protein